MSLVFKNSVTYSGDKKGVIKTPGKPDMEISPPAEFGGPEGVLTPEDLFIASLNSCLMLTFLSICRTSRIKITSYSSEAVGMIEKSNNKHAFTGINISVDIKAEGADRQKLGRLLDIAEKNCIISNSIKTKVNIKY